MQKDIKAYRLERLRSGDFEFNFTNYISKGFELIQQNIGGFIGFTLLWFIVQMIVGQLEQALAGMSLNIFSYIINAMWLPGFYIVANRIHKRKEYSFGNFFDGHKQGGRLIGVFFLMSLIAAIPIIPGIVSLVVNDSIIEEIQLFQEALQNQELYFPEISTLTLVLIIVGFIGAFYLQVSYLFAVPLVTFTNLGIWEAMELSRKVVAKKFLLVLVFVILLALINVGGFILLGIGILFTYPAAMCITYLAFEDIFQLETEDEDEYQDFTEHIVE